VAVSIVALLVYSSFSFPAIPRAYLDKDSNPVKMDADF
jgi:hypothetical protein